MPSRRVGCFHLGIAGVVLTFALLGLLAFRPEVMPQWLAEPAIDERAPIRKRIEYLENNLRIERARSTRDEAEIERLERERTRARAELER